jgi:hypothetical protein
MCSYESDLKINPRAKIGSILPDYEKVCTIDIRINYMRSVSI